MRMSGKLFLSVAAAAMGSVPVVSFAQGTVVRRDTVVVVHKDTVVHTKADTAIVTTRVTTNRSIPGDASVGVTLERLPNYKTLVSLLEEAHLMPSLRGAAPVTIFAPTDAAFANVSAADMADLKANPTKLRDLLLNHVVSGKIDTREILKLKTATTLRGTHIHFGFENGHPEVNNQPIVQPGIIASNGFIYGIAGVIGNSPIQ